MSFRPPFWASLLTAMAVLLFASLSSWQYQRGQGKADIIAGQLNAALGSAVPVRRIEELPAWGSRVELHGQWVGGQEVLLDNQTRQRRIGVHVLTPLRLQLSDSLVLVNRGWIQASPYRERLPETGSLPEGTVRVSGNCVVACSSSRGSASPPSAAAGPVAMCLRPDAGHGHAAAGCRCRPRLHPRMV